MTSPYETAAPDPEFQALVRSRFARDPRAMAELGARLIVGRDAPQSPLDGAALLEEAAKHDDPLAWSQLAVLSASGVARAQSWSDAFAAIDRAAQLGDASAEVQRGVLRDAVISTHTEAAQWLNTAHAEVLREVPRFVRLTRFLTPPLCEHLRARAQPKLVPARVNDARGGGLKLDPMRTNKGSVFSLIETDLVMQLVRARIARVAHVHPDVLEPPEVLHYDVGETYRQHVDFFHASLPTFTEEMRVKGQRVKTCLVYLNDDYEGGETDFPKIGLAFRGRAGDALLFDNVLPNGTGDMRTVHTGLPPTRGEKWLFSQWIRSKPQRIA
jgi:prolyl 4-hydroxylase